MRLKLDENLGRQDAVLMRRAGHDVDTVLDEGLSGSDDEQVLAAAIGADRALVTLDLDFADPWRFPPGETAGIAVLRVGDRPGRHDVDAALEQLALGLDREDIAGRLWVVDSTRIRRFEPGPDLDGP